MPPQCRLGDKSKVPSDKHGCPACPHTCIGPATSGSPNVFVNSKAATRVGDTGVHAGCCGPNTWKAVAGSATVFINGRAAHRKGDKDQHCGGGGNMIEGSPNVFVGDRNESRKLKPPFKGAFRLLYQKSKKPAAFRPYLITRGDGSEVRGTTDKEGYTDLVTHDEAEGITVEILPPEDDE